VEERGPKLQLGLEANNIVDPRRKVKTLPSSWKKTLNACNNNSFGKARSLPLLWPSVGLSPQQGGGGGGYHSISSTLFRFASLIIQISFVCRNTVKCFLHLFCH
jgi:hypothetical protein